MEVYDAVKNATEEHTAIAKFWDCNPFVSHHTGHVMYATKKSPHVVIGWESLILRLKVPMQI